MGYAQTNLQLYNQMRAAGYREEDLQLVRRAYDLGIRLFTAKFRGSGKPLLCHLVGTASVLCSLHVPANLLAAAVLHAAYIFGEFGDGRPGMTPAKRRTLQQAVGADVEDIVARYTLLEWGHATIEGLRVCAATLSPGDREVLIVRLANELEDHLDLGVLYCGNARQRRTELARSLTLCVELASTIGEPALAGELKRVFDEVLASDVPDVLRHPPDYTYMLAPASHMPRPAVSLRRRLDRHPRLALLLRPEHLLRRAWRRARRSLHGGTPVSEAATATK